MKTIATITLLALGVAAQAEWLVAKRAHYHEEFDFWLAGCFANLGTHDGLGGSADTLQLWINNWTVALRTQRGDPNVLKPLIWLGNVRANAGMSRPLDGPQFGRVCEDVEPGAPVCTDDLNEYRAVLRIDASRKGTETWVQQFEYEGPLPVVMRGEDPDNPALIPQIGVYYPDWPDELFETDATKSFRLHFGGLAGYGLPGDTKPSKHYMATRFTYDYGLDTMELLETCVEQHIRAGRMQPPPEEMIPLLSVPPR